ncbi:MAG: electron transfer flavoprotein subunit alpha/FixB family protein, partial [Dongiaceae bacterium]
MSKILVIAEHSDGKLNVSAVAKTLAAAQKIGGDVTVAVLAAGGAGAAAEAAKLAGVSKVVVVNNAANAYPVAAVLAPQIVELVQGGYTHVLFPGTTFGKDLAPRVAAKLNVQQVSDIMAVHGANKFDRPIYAGNAITTVEAPAGTVVATVRLASFTAVGEGGSAAVEA